MNDKKITILGIVAIVMVIWAVFQSRMANKPAAKVAVAAPLVQGFNPAEAAVIEVVKGQNKVVLTRKDNGFVVSQKSDYPAKNKTVNELITKVLDIKTRGEILTSNPDNFADLNITDANAETAVKFFDKENKLVTGVIIGKRLDSGETAVRLANSNDVYTTEDYVWLQTENTDYIEKELLNINADDTARVRVITAGSEYEMAKDPNSSTIKMATAIPAGKQLKGSDYEQVFKALNYFNISDVMPDGKDPNIIFDSKLICQMRDTTVYTVESAKKDDKYYVKVSADFKDRSQISIDRNEAEEELKKKEAILLARDKADEFHKKHKGWIYEVASYKAENLRKELSSLLEDIPQPAAADTNEPNEPIEVEDVNAM